MNILLILVMAFSFYACGSGGDDIYVKRMPENPGKPAPSPDLDPAVAALVDTHCGGCHAQGGIQSPIDSKARLKQSGPRIQNNSMPPGGGLSDEVKAKLLEG